MIYHAANTLGHHVLPQVGYGYRIAHIGDEHKHAGGAEDDWGADLGPMEEVMAGNLKYDLEDAKRFKVGVHDGFGSELEIESMIWRTPGSSRCAQHI